MEINAYPIYFVVSEIFIKKLTSFLKLRNVENLSESQDHSIYFYS